MSKILVCTKKYTIDDAQSTFTQMRGHENSQDVLDEIAVGYFLNLDYLNYYVSDSSMLENCKVIYEVDMKHRIYYDNENEVYYYVSTDRNDMPMRESMTRVFKRGYFDKYRNPNAKIKTAEDFYRENNIDEMKQSKIRQIIRESIVRHLNEESINGEETVRVYSRKLDRSMMERAFINEYDELNEGNEYEFFEYVFNTLRTKRGAWQYEQLPYSCNSLYNEVISGIEYHLTYDENDGRLFVFYELEDGKYDKDEEDFKLY